MADAQSSGMRDQASGYSTQSSKSGQIRKRGNAYFLQAREASGEQQHRLLELAVGLYDKALAAATDTADVASAHKNAAAALVHLAECNSNSNHQHERASINTNKAVELLTQAVQHRCRAHDCGEVAGLPDAWIEEAWDGIGVVVDKLQGVLSSWVSASPSSTASVLHQLDVLRSVVPEHCQLWLVDAMRQVLSSIRDTAAGLISPTGQRAGQAGPDWKTCLIMMAEAKRTLIEALELAFVHEDTEAADALLRVEDDMWAMKCRCESTQARLQGDQMLARVVTQIALFQEQQDKQQQQQQQKSESSSDEAQPHRNKQKPNKRQREAARQQREQAGQQQQQQQQQQQEQKQDQEQRRRQQQEQQQQQLLDGVLAVIDMFKSAALLARERDLQAEAHALSRLGHTYKVCAVVLDPTLKCDPLAARSAEERSRAAFLNVLGLVDSLPHRIGLMMEDWYREARDTISEFQRTTAAEETARKEKETAPVRESLREELTGLYAAANKGWLELLKHCYTQHPPINPSSRVTDFSGFNADTGKECLKKAILAYHPDKQAGPNSSRKWQVLAEEITKALTQKYECFK